MRMAATATATNKWVIMVRHAESAENALMQGVARGVSALMQLSLPSLTDLKSGMELASTLVQGTDECELSENGRMQVAEVRSLLVARKSEILPPEALASGVVLTCSPLLRARATCDGLFRTGELFPCDAPMEVLDSLREIAPSNPSRYMAGNESVGEFERWLSQRNERTAIVVGHSHFFKRMLRVPFKFSNCEVWRARFVPENPDGERWTELERVCGASTAKPTFGAEGPEAWAQAASASAQPPSAGATPSATPPPLPAQPQPQPQPPSPAPGESRGNGMRASPFSSSNSSAAPPTPTTTTTTTPTTTKPSNDDAATTASSSSSSSPSRSSS